VKVRIDRSPAVATPIAKARNSRARTSSTLSNKKLALAFGGEKTKLPDNLVIPEHEKNA